jgi:methylated-DNA-[protein]-cysteine S-methyltransferase
MRMSPMTTSIRGTIHASPFGPLTLRGDARGLVALEFPGAGDPLDEAGRAPDLFDDAVRQLDAYFAGERRRFDLELDLDGTPFQRAIWQRLTEIPYGATISYGALARSIGRPDGVRAVAAAVGRTPVPIVVPCHRVVAGDGGLTGYRGGLQRKQALLDLERRGVQSDSASARTSRAISCARLAAS